MIEMSSTFHPIKLMSYKQYINLMCTFQGAIITKHCRAIREEHYSEATVMNLKEEKNKLIKECERKKLQISEILFIYFLRFIKLQFVRKSHKFARNRYQIGEIINS